MIKIKDTRIGRARCYKDLSCGDFFEHSGNYYIKINDGNGGSEGVAFCLNQKECVEFFDWYTKVVPVDVEIIIKPEGTL